MDKDIFEDISEIKELFKSIKRNRSIVTITTISSIILSTLFALISKEVWKGEFQIVLDKQNNNNFGMLAQNLPQVSLFSNLLSGGTREFNTEIKVLESPLVLRSVYDYVKDQKQNEKIKSFNDLSFKDWKINYLTIRREPNTSILTVSYKDRDINLINEVLNKIANNYQIYSNKERVRRIELGIDYSTKQIKLYEEKSKQSLQEAKNFAIDHDLILSRNSLFTGNLDIQTEDDSLSSLDINPELVRVRYENKIRLLEKYLDKVNDIENNSEEIYYFAKSISNDELKNDNGILVKLDEINSQLQRLNLFYKNTDKQIIKLQSQKDHFIKLLHKEIRSYLNAEKEEARIILLASERPKGILIQYEGLVRRAFKDYATLNKLEDQYRILSLEKARSEDPWELITKPIVDEIPISPKRKRIIAVGLLGGFLIGSLISLFKDKKKDLIFNSSTAEKLVNLKLISESNLDKNKKGTNNLNYLMNEIVDKNQTYFFYFIEELETDLLEEFKNKIKLSNKNIRFINKFSEISNSDNFILVILLGYNTRKKLSDFNKKIPLIKANLIGMIALEYC